MKKTILLLLLLTIGIINTSNAQNGDGAIIHLSPTLFSYGEHGATLEEFTRQFYKNNPKESITKDTARYYLELFINFKLKVQQAKDIGMDTAAEFIAEMSQYKKQLAQPYMVDTSATEALIDEAYQNLKEEVKVSHIMAAVGYDALPKDTLVAYNKALDFLKKLKTETFDSVASKYSDDQSAKTNYGSLGYFTAFDMIYPFEKAAYNTKVGAVYGPFRTQFGYHVIKVYDRRPSRGKMGVSHLMLRLDENANDEDILRAKQKADSIYAEIASGKATFDEMVQEYSDDFNTKDKGGDIGFIESANRQYPENFREAIFSLSKNGEISKPVKTQFGFHIIKRNSKETLLPKDSLYTDLKRKISNPKDERYSLTKQAVINRIKNEYGFAENRTALETFKQKADSTILFGTWKDENHQNLSAKLFTIGKTDFTEREFSQFIELNQQTVLNKGKSTIIDELFNSFIEQKVWEYEENNLVNKFDKYRHLIQEYNDGILLFNLSEKRVWNKGITDTAGLKEYYEANKNRYMWNDRVNVSIYECQSEDICNKVYKWVKKGKADTTISRMAHEIHPLSLAIKNGKYEKEQHPVLNAVKWKKGRTKVELDGKHYVVVIKDVLKAQPKALSEIRGPITSEYQTKLEKEWIEELKTKYPVAINQQVLQSFLDSITN